MSIKADMKYLGAVAPGSELIESNSGTLGYQVMIECEDGNTSYMIWLTAKNRARALKDFDILGVPEAKLADERYVQDKLATDIAGKRIKFGTANDEYNGKTRVKVSWISRPGADGNAPRAMASFFGGTPVSDDDIPF